MENRQWERIRETFDAIVVLPEAERSARLALIGKTDPRMRDMLEALMRGNAIANAFLSPREPIAIDPTPDVAERPRDTHEVRRLLDATPSPPSAPRRLPSRRVLITTGALWLSVLVIVLGAFALGHDKTTTIPTWLDVDAPDSASAHSFGSNPISLSPDGSQIAYVGGPRNALFVRSLNDSRGPREVEGSDNARCPSYSPNGQWIVFTTNYQLVKIPAGGGTPATVVDSTVDDCALWIGDKQILFQRKASLFTVSSDGGSPLLVTRIDTLNDVRELHLSQALPGGKAALVSLASGEIGALSPADGKVTRLGKHGGTPRYANGYLLYDSAGLFVAPFSLRRMRVTGPGTQLPLRSSQFAASANGRIAYLDHGDQGDGYLSIVAVSTDGRTRALAAKIGDSFWPRLSPDGKRIALALRDGIWVYDLETQRITKLTDHSAGLRSVGWSSDSRRVVFLAPDSASVVRQVWDGTVPSRELIRLPVPATTFTMGPRHGFGAFGVSDARTIWIVPLDSPSAARPYIATKGNAVEPRMSHDGELLAYTSNESGRNEVYVRSLAGAPVLQISDSGGTQPVWGDDDHNLYYRGPSHVMRATLARGTTLRVARRDALFEDRYERNDPTGYDVIPGDKELLMVQRSSIGQHVGIVMDWPALLSRLAERR